MGQKSSKTEDIYVTDDVTHSKLPEEEVNEFIGRAREYTAVNVSVENEPSKSETSDKKRPSPPSHAITTILNKAHRRGYRLSFVIPKLDGSKPSKLSRNSFIEELEKTDPLKNEEKPSPKSIQTSHTVFLLRPKVRSRLKKEASMKHMEATRTFLNVMMDIEQKWGFGIKEFTAEKSLLESEKYLEKLREMISAEAKKGGKLLSVMIKNDDHQASQANGTKTENITETNEEKNNAKEDAKKPSNANLTLRMIFYHNFEKEATATHEYTVACHQIKCTEQALKMKKKVTPPKSDRKINVTWSEDWLSIFKDDFRLIEVVNVGELSPPNQGENDSNPKKIKPRQFQVSTICFYEKQVSPVADEEGKPISYNGMVREVWAPIDDNLQENLDNEAENYGKHGWELCTVLATSHVRMKPDGSEFQKCAIFFQRPKKVCVPKNEMEKSYENLADKEENDANGKVNETPSSPKEKPPKFGVALMKIDLDRTKLKATSPSHEPKQPDQPALSPIPAIKLKKVDKEKLNKEETKDVSVAQQFKLRPTEVKTKTPASENETEKEVPWMASLEKKRKAVLESENKTQKPDATQNSSVAAPPITNKTPIKSTKVKTDELKEDKDKSANSTKPEENVTSDKKEKATLENTNSSQALDAEAAQNQQSPDKVFGHSSEEADQSVVTVSNESSSQKTAHPIDKPSQPVDDSVSPSDFVPPSVVEVLPNEIKKAAPIEKVSALNKPLAPPDEPVSSSTAESLPASPSQKSTKNLPDEPVLSPPAESLPKPSQMSTEELPDEPLPPPAEPVLSPPAESPAIPLPQESTEKLPDEPLPPLSDAVLSLPAESLATPPLQESTKEFPDEPLPLPDDSILSHTAESLPTPPPKESTEELPDAPLPPPVEPVFCPPVESLPTPPPQESTEELPDKPLPLPVEPALSPPAELLPTPPPPQESTEELSDEPLPPPDEPVFNPPAESLPTSFHEPAEKLPDEPSPPPAEPDFSGTEKPQPAPSTDILGTTVNGSYDPLSSTQSELLSQTVTDSLSFPSDESQCHEVLPDLPLPTSSLSAESLSTAPLGSLPDELPPPVETNFSTEALLLPEDFSKDEPLLDTPQQTEVPSSPPDELPPPQELFNPAESAPLASPPPAASTTERTTTPYRRDSDRADDLVTQEENEAAVENA